MHRTRQCLADPGVGQPRAYLETTSAPVVRTYTKAQKPKVTANFSSEQPVSELSEPDSGGPDHDDDGGAVHASDSSQQLQLADLMEPSLEIGVGSQGAADEMDPDAEQPAMEPVVSEEEAKQRNYSAKIRRHRGSDPETSVERLRLPLSQTQLSELAAAIRAGFRAGQQSGKRISCMWKEPVTGAVCTARGYRSYGAVNGKHEPAKQFKVTCVLTPEARLWEYCMVLPHLSYPCLCQIACSWARDCLCSFA